mmetsp:Transcript_17029/g.47146  ORF Transcript_17029/g.47146 Transcript_17029/m.47146 type:complete len:134 (+) Transcript_17029:500-901(+)
MAGWLCTCALAVLDHHAKGYSYLRCLRSSHSLSSNILQQPHFTPYHTIPFITSIPSHALSLSLSCAHCNSQEGEPVEFSTITTPEGKIKASNVTGPMGAYVQGAPRRSRMDYDNYRGSFDGGSFGGSGGGSSY